MKDNEIAEVLKERLETPLIWGFRSFSSVRKKKTPDMSVCVNR